MSMLNSPYATPSRVRGIYRYLLQAPGQSAPRESLLKMVAPDALQKGGDDKEPKRKMASDALSEGLKAGLFVESNEVVTLNPQLPSACRDPLQGDTVLPAVMASLFTANDENRDFLRVGSWYLAQDPLTIRGTWDEVQKTMIDLSGGSLFNMNDIRFGQFEDWFCFLGLGWIQGGLSGLVPEPSAFLRRQLPELFPKGIGSERQFIPFMADLGNAWPVFEGGEMRADIERTFAPREPHMVSSSTALALFRLEREGVLRLDYSADADGLVMPKGDTTWSCTHITWLKA